MKDMRWNLSGFCSESKDSLAHSAITGNGREP